MLAVTAAAGVSRYFMRNILIGLSRQIERAQRENIFGFLLRMPGSFYERQSTGDLMSRIGEDVSTVRMATGPGLMSLLQTASVLPMTLALMASADIRLSLALLAPFAVLPGCYYLLGRWSHANQQKLQLSNSALTTFSHETISGEKVVQAFGLEKIRLESFRGLSAEQARLNVLQTGLFSSYGPLAMVAAGASAIVLVWYGGASVMAGRLGMGDLTAFTGYLAALGWPVMSIGWAANLFQRGRAGQARIWQLMASGEAPVPPPDGGGRRAAPAASAASAASIEAVGLEIRFASGRGLGPISFAVPAGGSLALVGGVGSGKTLLLQALAGIREPGRGEVRVGGGRLGPGSLRTHWENIGWVPQEAGLFSGSLRENLLLGRPSAGEAEIWDAARAVCLDDLILRLPDGLETVVGERGVVLSGGERQRAALARALLRRPGVLLMDDSLSAVDSETESRILSNLKPFLGGATVVLATHRAFVAELCDSVAVLEEGRLAQSGAPRALAAVDGPYARMRRLQSMEGGAARA
jgi:ATP-binding cassette subfamily B protein